MPMKSGLIQLGRSSTSNAKSRGRGREILQLLESRTREKPPLFGIKIQGNLFIMPLCGSAGELPNIAIP